MCTTPRMTRLKENTDRAVSKLADSKKWSISQTIAELVENSPMLLNFLDLEDQTDGKEAA